MITIKHRPPTTDEYMALREAVDWWLVATEATETALSNALFSVVALEDERVVGIGRVVGDGGLYFYIQDLMVHPDFQEHGLGRQLMMELMAYIKGCARPGAFVGLMAAKGLESYYESFGFCARNSDAPGMYQIIK